MHTQSRFEFQGRTNFKVVNKEGSCPFQNFNRLINWKYGNMSKYVNK